MLATINLLNAPNEWQESSDTTDLHFVFLWQTSLSFHKTNIYSKTSAHSAVHNSRKTVNYDKYRKYQDMMKVQAQYLIK